MRQIQEVKIKKKIEKLQTFNSNYFPGKGHFEEDGTQNYLVFHPYFHYFKTSTNSDKVKAQKLKY